jgi:hypothetical protein
MLRFRIAAVLGTALTLMAFAASAQAETAGFVASSYPVTLTGKPATSSSYAFGSVSSRIVSCTEETWSSSLTSNSLRPSSSLTFGGCTNSPGGGTATVKSNECTYAQSPQSTSSSEGSVSLDIECPAGKSIEIQALSSGGTLICAYTLGPQTGIAFASYKDEGTGASEDVAETLKSSALKVTVVTGTAAACGASAPNTTSLTISGTLTLKGSNAKSESVGVRVSPLGRFTAAQYPATLSGNQSVQHSFSIGTKEIECSEAKFPATLTEASNSVAIAPEYSGCRFEPSLITTVSMNGCTYTLTAPIIGSSAGSTKLVCPSGQKVEYHVYENEAKRLAEENLCLYTVGAQTPGGSTTIENLGSGATADLRIKYAETGLVYTAEGPKLRCGSSGSNGEYTGASTEKAKNGKGEQIELMIG